MVDKIKLRTIDCTPTWRGVLPLMLAAYTEGTPTGRKIALEELQRMADIADAALAEEKRQKGEPDHALHDEDGELPEYDKKD